MASNADELEDFEVHCVYLEQKPIAYTVKSSWATIHPNDKGLKEIIATKLESDSPFPNPNDEVYRRYIRCLCSGPAHQTKTLRDYVRLGGMFAVQYINPATGKSRLEEMEEKTASFKKKAFSKMGPNLEQMIDVNQKATPQSNGSKEEAGSINDQINEKNREEKQCGNCVKQAEQSFLDDIDATRALKQLQRSHYEMLATLQKLQAQHSQLMNSHRTTVEAFTRDAAAQAKVLTTYLDQTTSLRDGTSQLLQNYSVDLEAFTRAIVKKYKEKVASEEPQSSSLATKRAIDQNAPCSESRKRAARRIKTNQTQSTYPDDDDQHDISDDSSNGYIVCPAAHTIPTVASHDQTTEFEIVQRAHIL